MIGFGENNEEFGKLSPGLVSFEEQLICDDDDSRLNSLIIRLKTETGIKLRIQFDDYLMYMSRNESFTCGDEYEKHKGMWLVTFEALSRKVCKIFLKVHKSMHFQPRWISPRLEKAEVKSCARISQYGL